MEEWRTDDQCLEAEKFVNMLKCTIDVGERGNMIIRMMMMMIIQYCTLAGVKLTTEYMQVLTKDSRMRQKIWWWSGTGGTCWSGLHNNTNNNNNQ